MIEFPETAQAEWKIVAEAAEATHELRARLERETRIDRELENRRVRYAAEQLHKQELDADATPTLDMVTLADWRANPNTTSPTDLIEGVLKEDGLCIFLGPSSSGKSTLALQALHSLATGDEWLGQPVTKISGSVGILSYDMPGGLVMDWLDGMPGMNPTKISVVNAYKRGNPLGVPAMRAQIAAAWRAMQVEVVVLDSFSASFFGPDQNDAAAVMNHYRDMKLFALTEVGARALLVITHSTEASPHKARGSTVHVDVADTMVSVVADPMGQRTVRMEKYREARGQTAMSPVVVTRPDSVTHLVTLDIGAMHLAGMQLPASQAAAAFTDMPETYEDPDTDSDSGDEDDDL